MRLMLRLAFLALPFQIRQRSRSTSSTIIAFACTLLGLSADRPLAACVACWNRIAIWNQSRMGGVVTPAPTRTDPQTWTAISEGGHHCGVGSANSSKVSMDQRRDVGTSLRHRSEHLPASVTSLDISDADLQVPLAVFATADEGRIHADGDRRSHSCWPARGRGAKLLADPQGMTA